MGYADFTRCHFLELQQASRNIEHVQTGINVLRQMVLSKASALHQRACRHLPRHWLSAVQISAVNIGAESSRYLAMWMNPTCCSVVGALGFGAWKCKRKAWAEWGAKDSSTEPVAHRAAASSGGHHFSATPRGAWTSQLRPEANSLTSLAIQSPAVRTLARLALRSLVTHTSC